MLCKLEKMSIIVGYENSQTDTDAVDLYYNGLNFDSVASAFDALKTVSIWAWDREMDKVSKLEDRKKQTGRFQSYAGSFNERILRETI